MGVSSWPRSTNDRPSAARKQPVCASRSPGSASNSPPWSTGWSGWKSPGRPSWRSPRPTIPAAPSHCRPHTVGSSPCSRTTITTTGQGPLRSPGNRHREPPRRRLPGQAQTPREPRRPHRTRPVHHALTGEVNRREGSQNTHRGMHYCTTLVSLVGYPCACSGNPTGQDPLATGYLRHPSLRSRAWPYLRQPWRFPPSCRQG